MAEPELAGAISGIKAQYSQSEIYLIGRVNKRLAKGIQQEGWTERKLAEVAAFRKELAVAGTVLDKYASAEVDKLLTAAYRAGASSAAFEVGTVGTFSGGLVKTNAAALRALYSQTYGSFAGANLRILRSTMDAYRSVIAEATAKGTAGVLTRLQASQEAMNRLAKQGITSFVDKAGRNWQMDSYTEMAARTGMNRAHLEGRLQTLSDAGISLFRVSDSPEECPYCRPWEGMVLSLKPHKEYPTIQEAKDQGLFHASCTHTLNAYTPGMEYILNKPQSNAAGYEDRMEQRRLERKVREAKRLEAAAMTPQAARAAAAKVKAATAELKAFAAAKDRKLLGYRSSVGPKPKRIALETRAKEWDPFTNTWVDATDLGPPGIGAYSDRLMLQGTGGLIPKTGLPRAGMPASPPQLTYQQRVDAFSPAKTNKEWEDRMRAVSGPDFEMGGFGPSVPLRSRNEILRSWETIARDFPEAVRSVPSLHMGFAFGGRNAYAHVLPQGNLFPRVASKLRRPRAMELSPKYYKDPEAMAQSLAGDARMGWHYDPTIAGVTNHEMGHVIQAWAEKTFTRYADDMKRLGSRASGESAVSVYGNKSSVENFAEAFAEIYAKPASEWKPLTQRIWDTFKGAKSGIRDDVVVLPKPLPKPIAAPKPIPAPRPGVVTGGQYEGEFKGLTNQYNNLSSKISRDGRAGLDTTTLRAEREVVKTQLAEVKVKWAAEVDLKVATSEYNTLSTRISKTQRAGGDTTLMRIQRENARLRIQAAKRLLGLK